MYESNPTAKPYVENIIREKNIAMESEKGMNICLLEAFMREVAFELE